MQRADDGHMRQINLQAQNSVREIRKQELTQRVRPGRSDALLFMLQVHQSISDEPPTAAWQYLPE